MSTLHEVATSQYSEHYARMNPTLDPRAMPERLYRNMALMYGPWLAGVEPGGKVADLGCGTGFLLHWLTRDKRLDVTGVDVCEEQARLAQAAVPEATVLWKDALSFLQQTTERYDVLFCIDVLEHIEDEQQCLALVRLAHDKLRPCGRFICRAPNAAHILGSYSRYIDITHHRSFTSHSMTQLLHAGGFSSVQLIPTRSSILLGRLRLVLEHAFHRALFLLGGFTMERVFSQNVIAVGIKS